MTQGDAGAAGEAADPGRVAASQPVDSSAWAPLGLRVSRWLWLSVLISWIGTWMQIVGAQWQLVDEPNVAALVSLVQAASTLPMMLLALPGGVLADSFDRRSPLITVQAYLFVVAIPLAVLAAAGQMPPALLLVFTFALGADAAVQVPPWQAMMPERAGHSGAPRPGVVRDEVRPRLSRRRAPGVIMTQSSFAQNGRPGGQNRVRSRCTSAP
jgi:MFS family permease